MALNRAMCAMILQEHVRNPIKGRVLQVGRQTILLTPAAAMTLIEEVLGRIPREPRYLKLDDYSQNVPGHEHFISDKSFFSLFTDAIVEAMDVSGYEHAEVVHDLSYKVPQSLIGRYDFIVNGSCLDNLFDPAEAMRNMSEMTSKNGVIIHLEHGSSMDNAYLMYSPSWFHDYYAINRWQHCDVYVANMTKKPHMTSPWDLYHWDPVSPTHKSRWIVDTEMLVVRAVKGLYGQSHMNPIQVSYREGSPHSETYEASVARWRAAGVPKFDSMLKVKAYPSVHRKMEKCYTYCGTFMNDGRTIVWR